MTWTVLPKPTPQGKYFHIEVYAMKVLKKREMVLRDQVENIWSERQLLIADNPWFCQLHFSFQDKKYLYLVMDFCSGGDLMELLIRKHTLSEYEARFYAAELATAIDQVHQMNFAHRDLKPDNILIDMNGHIKLTDFGLCKEFCERQTNQELANPDFLDELEAADFKVGDSVLKGDIDAFDVLDAEEAEDLVETYRRQRSQFKSMVGTANYMAPEIFQRKGYDKTVDWWAFGAILFEMICGYAPFCSRGGDDEVGRRVIRYKRTFYVPRRSNASPDAIRLMKGLITEPSERLDFKEIKSEPWFKGTHWDRLRTTKAPWIPRLRCSTDTVNFDNFGSPAIFKNPGITPSEFQQRHFRGFTYSREDVSKTRHEDQLLRKCED